MSVRTVDPEFYTIVHDAMTTIQPRLAALVGRGRDGRPRTGGAVHEFALAASSRIAGIIIGGGWGYTADAVIAAAEKASEETGRSVDAFMRAYETASETIQTERNPS